MRLIDPKASTNRLYVSDFVFEQMQKIPTIDAVPVVRCKDCVQWDRHCGIVDSPNGHCWTHDIEMNGYDFCSYGERKGG